jgi:transcriptional regulator with XRE-family HTH domain
MPRQPDFLDELDAERIAANPDPRSLTAARERRALTAQFATKRRELKIPQVEVARRIATSQAFVSRFESHEVDPQHSTEDRYAAALGLQIERRRAPSGQ